MSKCDYCGQEIGKEAQKLYEERVLKRNKQLEREKAQFIKEQREQLDTMLLEKRKAIEVAKTNYEEQLKNIEKSHKVELEKLLNEEREINRKSNADKLVELENLKETIKDNQAKYRSMIKEREMDIQKALNAQEESLSKKSMAERKKLEEETSREIYKKDEENTKLRNQVSTIKKSIDLEIENAIKQEREENNLANQMIQKKHEIEIQKMRDHAQSIANSKVISSELSGEMLEGTIKDMLEMWFDSPLYDIQDISKGRRGGDHLISIRVDNHVIGKIKIETKNTKKWDESWINKLNDDMLEHEANFGIIISKTEPKYFDSPWFIKNDHISICNLKSKNAIKNLIISYSNIILAEHKARKLKSNESQVTKCITDWIESPILKQNVQKLYRSITDAEDDIGKDERAFIKSIAKRKAKSEIERQSLQNIFLPLEELDLKQIHFFDEGSE